MLTVTQETHRPWQNEQGNRKRTQQKKPPEKSKVLRGKCSVSANKDLANYLSNSCHEKSREILQKSDSGVVSFGRKEINCEAKAGVVGEMQPFLLYTLLCPYKQAAFLSTSFSLLLQAPHRGAMGRR